MYNNLGNEKGEICNRNNCAGIISEHETETSCSCHSNPPCSHCTTDRNFCPECDWSAQEEQRINDQNYRDSDIYKQNQEYYKRQNNEWDKARKLFYEMYSGKVAAEKLIIRTEPHTHFTQKVFGVFPIGTETRSSLLHKVDGAFGGRWEKFNDYSFCYIAYTD